MFGDKSSSSRVASVGKIKISGTLFQQEIKTALEQYAHTLSQQTGKPIDVQTVKKMALANGLPVQILQKIVQSALLLQEAKALGVQASDEQVRETIQSVEAFLDEEGHFSKERFHHVLRENRMTENHFVEKLRDDLSINNYLSSLTGLSLAPELMTKKFFSFDREKRQVLWTLFTEDLYTQESFKFEDAELKAFYSTNQQLFKDPEYRKLEVLLLSLESLKSKYTVTTGEIKSEFERRKAEFTMPEQRKIFQVMTPHMHIAEKAESLLRSHVKAQDLPALLGEEEVVINEGTKEGRWVEAKQLPNNLAKIIFSLKKGETSAVFKTRSGYYVFVVQDIKGATTTSFEDVKQAIESDILKQKAKEELYELVKKVEDEVSGGANFKEVANKYHFVTITYDAIDVLGNKKSTGKKEEGSTLGEILRAGFETPENAESSTIELANGDMAIVKVLGVTPAQVVVFEQAKPKVAEALKNKMIQEKLQALASQFEKGADKLNQKDKVRISGTTMGRSVMISRTGQMNLDKKAPEKSAEHKLGQVLERSDALAVSVIDALFNKKVGDRYTFPLAYINGEGKKCDAYLVGKITGWVPADDKEYAKDREAYSRMMSQALTNDIATMTIQHLQKKYPVKINEAFLDQFQKQQNAQEE